MDNLKVGQEYIITWSATSTQAKPDEFRGSYAGKDFKGSLIFNLRPAAGNVSIEREWIKTVQAVEKDESKRFSSYG